MKKKLKRILSAMLVAVMLVGIAPVGGIDLSVKSSAMDLSSYKVGDLIKFGSYPQSKVTDSTLISKLETEGSKYKWVDYKYYAGTGLSDGNMKPVEDMMLYKDIHYGGKKYRAVKINAYRPTYTEFNSSIDNSIQDNHGYYAGNVYYFKFEQLTWRILDPSKGYVMCNSIIDSQAFQNFSYYNGSQFYNSKSCSNYASDWSTSSLKQWLNNDFYNTAFTDEEKLQIGMSHLENKSTESNIFDGADTYDKIFLISYYDSINSAYGFNPSNVVYDTARQMLGTDYAECQGLGALNSGYSWWRLRSPNVSSYTAEMSDKGYVTNGRDGVGSTMLGVVPAFKFNSKASNPETSETRMYVAEHIGKYNRNHTDWEYNGFYDSVDQEKIKKNKKISRIWSIIEDAGKVASLDFKDLQINADYYDMYLAGMVMSFTENTTPQEIKFETGSFYSQSLGMVESFLDSNKEYYKLKDLFNINSAFKEDYKISKEAQETFNTIFNNAYKKNPAILNSIFQGLDCAGEICDDINLGLNAFNSFKDCYQAYCIAQATKEMCTEFFDICYDTANELSKTNSKFAGWFRKNVDKYFSGKMTDSMYYSAAKQSIHEIGYTAYDTVLKTALSGIINNAVAKILGNGITAGQISVIVASYNFGVALANVIAPTDTDSAYYMFYVSPVEKALQTVMKRYANDMISQKTYYSAVKYDVAFRMLKQTNIALYGKAYEFAAKHRILWIKTKSMKQNMEDATYYQGLWKRSYCHLVDYEKVKNAKTVGVKCPVDVFLYNTKNELVVAIENEEITKYKDKDIAVNVCNGYKAISYSADEDYSIKIVARESGTMEYTVLSSADKETRCVEFFDISLSPSQQFDGTIPGDHEALGSKFDLVTKGEKIVANNDFVYSEDSKPTINDETLSVGDEITFGSYPQTEVTDATTLKKLNSLLINWSSYDYSYGKSITDSAQATTSDYMQYADIVYGGEKYRAVKMSQLRPSINYYPSSTTYSEQDDNGYDDLNKVYWFKYEPLKWIVLDSTSGLVMCKNVIDSQEFNKKIFDDKYGDSNHNHFANNYEQSSIRNWLNKDFYNIAFSSADKTHIEEKTLSNVAYDKAQFNSGDTTDKITLLSFAEYQKIKNDYRLWQAGCSNYALCQGVSSNSGNTVADWMLRTAGTWSDVICSVSYSGAFSTSSTETYNSSMGIRPVVYLKTKNSESKPKVQGVSVGSDIKINYKKSETINYSVTADKGAKYSVSFASSNPKVATVDNNGKVYAAKKGSATITCTVTDSNGNTVQDTCKVTVKYSFGQWLIKILLFGWIWY